eukprot:947588-Rhodomonas_salina.1
MALLTVPPHASTLPSPRPPPPRHSTPKTCAFGGENSRARRRGAGERGEERRLGRVADSDTSPDRARTSGCEAGDATQVTCERRRCSSNTQRRAKTRGSRRASPAPRHSQHLSSSPRATRGWPWPCCKRRARRHRQCALLRQAAHSHAVRCPPASAPCCPPCQATPGPTPKPEPAAHTPRVGPRAETRERTRAQGGARLGGLRQLQGEGIAGQRALGAEVKLKSR